MAGSGRYINSEEVIYGGVKVHHKAGVLTGAISNAVGEIANLIASRPAGGGEEGERFDKSHEAVVTALDASVNLREQIQELGENVVNGALSADADDQIASQILKGKADANPVQDIPDFKY